MIFDMELNYFLCPKRSGSNFNELEFKSLENYITQLSGLVVHYSLFRIVD